MTLAAYAASVESAALQLDGRSRHLEEDSAPFAEWANGACKGAALEWQLTQLVTGQVHYQSLINPIRNQIDRLPVCSSRQQLSLRCPVTPCHAVALSPGVEWFGRVCVALGVDPPSAFRAWVSSLGPELLKGPFNHQERQLVSTGCCLCDINSASR